MEKVYNTMKKSGVACIAVGIIVIVVGIATGVIAIINGSKLLEKKDDITF